MDIIHIDYDWAGPLVRRTRTELLVLHQCAQGGSARALHTRHLRRGWTGIGYHYYIRRDGRVYAGRPDDCVGAHTSCCDGRSVGICFEGDFETEEMPEAQLRAGVQLLQMLRVRYGPLAIVPHRDAEAADCPGSRFPIERLRGLTEAGQTER